MHIGRRVPNVHREGHLCLDNCGNYPGLKAINKPAQRPSPLSWELQDIHEQKRQENIEKIKVKLRRKKLWGGVQRKRERKHWKTKGKSHRDSEGKKRNGILRKRKKGGEEEWISGRNQRKHKCRRSISGGLKTQKALAQTGALVRWGEGRSLGRWEPPQGQMPPPRAPASQVSQCKGNPRETLWAQSALYPDLMMPFIWFLNSRFAAFWAGMGVC